jgi:AraC family transcriptional regulator
VDFACKELVGSEKAMSEIALAAGFSDQSHFNRSFKRETGVSPTQYRDAQRSA